MLFEMVIMPFLDAEIMPLPIRAIMLKLCRRGGIMPKLCCLKMGSKFLKRRAWPKLGRAKVPTTSSSLGCRNWAGNACGSIGIMTVFVHFRHFDMVRCEIFVNACTGQYCNSVLL